MLNDLDIRLMPLRFSYMSSSSWRMEWTITTGLSRSASSSRVANVSDTADDAVFLLGILLLFFLQLIILILIPLRLVLFRVDFGDGVG